MRQLLPYIMVPVLALLTAMTSCTDYNSKYDSDPGFPDDVIQEWKFAVVTVMPRQEGSYVMVVDSDNVYAPRDFPASPFGRYEARAIAMFAFLEKKQFSPEGYEMVAVQGLSEIPTPPTAPAASLPPDWGQGEITVSPDWPTLIADGYLTLSVTVNGAPSYYPEGCFKLVTGIDPDNPCAMELRYNPVYPDSREPSKITLAFNLNKLPGLKTGDDLTLEWLSPGGRCTLRLPIRLRDNDTPAS